MERFQEQFKAQYGALDAHCETLADDDATISSITWLGSPGVTEAL